MDYTHFQNSDLYFQPHIDEAKYQSSKAFATPSNFFPPAQHRKVNTSSDFAYGQPTWSQPPIESYRFPHAATHQQPALHASSSSTEFSNMFSDSPAAFHASPDASAEYGTRWTPDFFNCTDLNNALYAECLEPIPYTHRDSYASSDLWTDSLSSSRRSSASDISSSSGSSSYSHFVQVAPGTPQPRADSPAGSDSSNNTPRRRFPCLLPNCGRRFTSQYTLKVHMEAHKPKPRPSFPCTLGCSESFSRQHDRLRHEVAKHNKVCEFLCDECGRFFSTQKTLSNHKCPMAQGATRWINTVSS